MYFKVVKVSFFHQWIISFCLFTLLIAFGLPIQAASSSWTTDTDGSWINAGLWSAGVPGTATGSNSTDIATFAVTATAPRLVTVDTNRNIGGITFSSDSPTDVNGYTLSTNTVAGKGAVLKLSNGGVVQSVDGGGVHTDTINSRIEVQGNGGTGTFRNDSSGNTVVLGDIAGASASGSTNRLIFDGASVALNSSAIISDGSGGGRVSVLKTGSGYWTFLGQSTFSGGLAVGQGTAGFIGSGAQGLGVGGITVSNGTAFYHADTNAMTITNPVVAYGNFTLAGGAGGALGGGLNLAGVTRVITVNDDFAISGSVSNGGLYINGGGILTLSGSNPYTNGTTLAGFGGLSLGHVNALGTGPLGMSTGSGYLYIGNNLTNGGGVTNPITLNAYYNRIACPTNWSATFGGVISAGVELPTLEFSSTCRGSSTATITLNAKNTWGDTVFKVGGSQKLKMMLGTNDALPTAGLLAIDSGTSGNITFDLNGFNQTVAGCNLGFPDVPSDPGPIFIQNSSGTATLTFDVPLMDPFGNPGDYMISGQNRRIQNSGTGVLAVVKTGPGTQRISGNDGAQGGMTYSGGTLILGGTFVAGTNGIGTGIVAITNALLQVDAATSLTIKSNLFGNSAAIIDLNGGVLTNISNGNGDFAGVISGTGSFVKAGTGTLTLAGTNTFSGPATNSAGTLLVNGLLSSSDVWVDGGTLGGKGTIGGAVTLALGASIAPGSNAVGTLTLSNNLTLNGGGTLAYELVGVPNSDKLIVRGNLSPSGTTTINLGASAMTNGTYTLIEVTGTLGGGTNNFAVTGGFGGKAYSLAYQSGVTNKVLLTVTDGVRNLVWTGSSGTSSNLWDVNLSTNWSTSIAHDKFQNNDPATFNDIGLTNPVVNITVAVSPSAVTVNSSGNYTFGGAGKITGTNALTKSGAGTLTLNSLNDYSGGTTNNAGAIAMGHVNALGVGRLTLAGGTLNVVSNLNSGSGVTNSITLAADTTVSCSTNFAAIWGGVITNSGTLRTLTFSSSSRTTRATNILTQPNSWGDTIMSVGGSQLLSVFNGVANALPTNGVVTLTAGTAGNVQWNLNGYDQTIAGLSSGGGQAQVTSSGGNPVLTLNIAAGTNYNHWGQNKTITGSLTLVKTGAGTQRIGLTGAQGGVSHTGGTRILGGTLMAGVNGIGSGPVAITNAVLQVETNLSLTISSNLLGNAGAAIDLNGGILTNSFNTTASEFAGAITNTGSFVKAGTGSLTLSGTNTYPGTTTVSGGRLLVNSAGALAGGGAVAVKNGAVLGGSGSVAGAITVESGGTLQPGLDATNIPATFTCSNLTFSAGSTNLIMINNTNLPNANKIVYTGGLTNGGTLVVSNVGPALVAGNSFTLFSGVTSPVGVYGATNLPILSSPNLSWVFTNGVLSVTSTVNTTPTNIVAVVTNGLLRLTWPADHIGWELQGQTNVLSKGISTNWTVVAGSALTNQISIPIVSTNPSVFYRLHLP